MASLYCRNLYSLKSVWEVDQSVSPVNRKDGRGQLQMIEVAQARDELLSETEWMCQFCSDGGSVQDTHGACVGNGC